MPSLSCGQVDAAPAAEADVGRPPEQVGEPDAQPELVEVDVARVADRLGQVERAVAGRVPAVPSAVPPGERPVAGHVHLLVRASRRRGRARSPRPRASTWTRADIGPAPPGRRAACARPCSASPRAPGRSPRRTRWGRTSGAEYRASTPPSAGSSATTAPAIESGKMWSIHCCRSRSMLRVRLCPAFPGSVRAPSKSPTMRPRASNSRYFSPGRPCSSASYSFSIPSLPTTMPCS